MPTPTDHLRTALTVSVPLEIDRIRNNPPDTLDALTTHATTALQEGADDLQFGGHRGRAGTSFAAHTRALAILALRSDGGVDFAGLHWCQTRGCRARSRLDHADMTEAPHAAAPRQPTGGAQRGPDQP